jgi:Kdo2-lipid IVA lauroyltransferase/acyltransferase
MAGGAPGRDPRGGAGGASVKHRLEHVAVVVVMAIVRVTPWPLVRGTGRVLGVLFFASDRKRRRVTLDNLAHAFPWRSARERRAIARGVFAHFGRLLFDLLKFATLSHEQMLARVEWDGDERVRQAQAQGKGYLLVTGHFGFWEMQGIVHGLRLGPIGVLARPLDNPYLNVMLERVRQSSGNAVIYRRGAIRRVMRMLQANQGVGLLIDQHVHTPDAVLVDFFDRPAATTSSLAVLALRTGAPVVPLFAIPLPDGRYRMIYEHPVEPPRDDTPEEIRAFTQRCTDVLEMYVRRYPELWLWMHRRWRDVPIAADVGATPDVMPE